MTTISEDDKEVRKASTFNTAATESATLLQRLEQFSDWFKANKAIAVCIRYVKKLKNIAKIRDPKDQTEQNAR